MPDEAAEKQPQKPETPQPAEEKKGPSPFVKKLVLALVILGVVGAEAVVAFLVVKATRQEDPRVLAEEKSKMEDEKKRRQMTLMGATTEPIEVIVNVGAGDEERYAKVAVQLEFDDQKYPELLNLLELRKPKVKTLLIELLTAMELADLVSPIGKTKLRQNILREVNKTLPKDAGEIRDVFLSEFVIQ